MLTFHTPLPTDRNPCQSGSTSHLKSQMINNFNKRHEMFVVLRLPCSMTGAIKSVQLEYILALIWNCFVAMLGTAASKAAGTVA